MALRCFRELLYDSWLYFVDPLARLRAARTLLVAGILAMSPFCTYHFMRTMEQAQSSVGIQSILATVGIIFCMLQLVVFCHNLP